MIRTIAEETYYDETIAKTGKIYARCRNVMFNTDDKMIVAYLEKGAEFLEEVVEIQGTASTDEFGVVTVVETPVVTMVAVQKKLTTEIVRYSNDTMKQLIDAIGEVYNEDGSNFLVDEIERLSDLIILADIGRNPQKYFGLLVAKFEKVV